MCAANKQYIAECSSITVGATVASWRSSQRVFADMHISNSAADPAAPMRHQRKEAIAGDDWLTGATPDAVSGQNPPWPSEERSRCLDMGWGL